jgi:multicomponent Na+:H+ antiporter subunit B
VTSPADGRDGTRTDDADAPATRQDPADADHDAPASGEDRSYVESPVVLVVARLLGPFVVTFGAFVTLHGATSPGGGFQGGVVVAAAVVLLAFAHGVDAVRRWLAGPTVGRLVAGGVGLFLAVALGSLAAGGSLLEYAQYGVDPKYVGELVEVAIGLAVSGVLVALFVLLAPAGDTVSAMAAARAAPAPGQESGADPDAATDGGSTR